MITNPYLAESSPKKEERPTFLPLRNPSGVKPPVREAHITFGITMTDVGGELGGLINRDMRKDVDALTR